MRFFRLKGRINASPTCTAQACELGIGSWELHLWHPFCEYLERRYPMAKYSRGASKTVESAMRRRKRGTLKSGSGRKVKSRKQAIAIGLSEARKKGAKVPRKRKGTSKRASKKR